MLAEISSGEELPYGWGVELEAGHYRLCRREDGAAFAHSAGPQSWKNYLHPQRERQWTADRSPDGSVSFTAERAEPRSYAFVGVRPCDLRAIAVQDRVLSGGDHSDSAYRRRRDRAFLVVAECTDPGATCFCVSMNAGPGADSGYDLALTEVIDDSGHRFLARAGSAQGASVLAGLPHQAADGLTRDAARRSVDEAAKHIGRSMPPVSLQSLMRDTLEAERWDDVAARCLTCGNCTMVCPTCFSYHRRGRYRPDR